MAGLPVDVKSFISITMKNTALQKARGRPREFDREKALAAAMNCFWRHGYEATSLNHLSRAMDLNPPSIYGSFGDKRQLFSEAVQAYLEGPGCFAARALLEEKDARTAIERLLLDAVDAFTSSEHPSGCMVVLSALNCTEASSDVRDELARLRNGSLRAITGKLQEAKSKLPPHLSPDAFGNLVVTVFQGLSIRARDGATREELKDVVAGVMSLWPRRLDEQPAR